MITIKLEGIHEYGSCYSVEYSDKKGQKEYYYGLKSMQKFIESAADTIKLEDSAGYNEHSELIKIIEKRSKPIKEEGEPKNGM